MTDSLDNNSGCRVLRKQLSDGAQSLLLCHCNEIIFFGDDFDLVPVVLLEEPCPGNVRAFGIHFASHSRQCRVKRRDAQRQDSGRSRFFIHPSSYIA